MNSTIWLLMLVIYQAPADAVDWNGPWKYGMNQVVKQEFQTEAECRTFAVQTIGRIHQGMLAPIRYRCIPLDATLPENAPR